MQAFFTTTKEGNMGLHVGDDPLVVLENRKYLGEKLGVSNVVFMNQVHGDRVCYVDENTTQTPTCDAMISNSRHIALAVMVADCIPLVFYDAKTCSMGVAHAGREGTRLKIASKTLQAMHAHFGAKVEDIQVFMGPSIQDCCYEVGQEATKDLEHVMEQRGEKFFLNLSLANQKELLNAGIQKAHLHCEKSCTCCDKTYFSYRRERQTGRFVGVIRL